MSNEVGEEIDSRMEPGAELRHERENQGRALEDVAHEMHMKVWQVEALENGDYDRLAGAVFVQGYIRTYARLLEIDAAPLLAAFNSGQSSTSTPRLEINPPIEVSDGKNIWLPLVTALITASLVAAFVIWLNANGYLGTRFGYVEPHSSTEMSLPLAESAQEAAETGADREVVEQNILLPGSDSAQEDVTAGNAEATADEPGAITQVPPRMSQPLRMGKGLLTSPARRPRMPSQATRRMRKPLRLPNKVQTQLKKLLPRNKLLQRQRRKQRNRSKQTRQFANHRRLCNEWLMSRCQWTKLKSLAKPD